MKNIITVALVLNLSAAGVYAQDWPVKMRFSGTNVATTINLQPNTVTDELHAAGDGTFGPFTFRELHADLAPSPQPPPGCSGPNFAIVSGAGVLSFRDGSLLNVTVMNGSGCINLAAGNAAIAVQYQIAGGTGRFEGAFGTLNVTWTHRVLLRSASNTPTLLVLTGEIEGTVSRQP